MDGSSERGLGRFGFGSGSGGPYRTFLPKLDLDYMQPACDQLTGGHVLKSKGG